MNTEYKTNARSLNLVQRLLENSYIEKNTVTVIRHSLDTEPSPVRFDEKGSTRVEILFDTVDKGKTGKTVRLHGLTENCEEERAPIVFYCKSSWVNDETNGKIDDSSMLPLKSFVIDPAENPAALSNTEFSVTFENPHDGTLLATGEGYLRFGRDSPKTV